jgi:RNA polymerase sigma-70 factor (ECF subfamily)
MEGAAHATDEDLVARVAAGDPDALETLVDRWRARLYAFCHRNLGVLGVPAAEVDDVVQETWLRVVRAAARFDPERRFPVWLFSIAVNLCRDARRRRRMEVGTEDDAAATEAILDEPHAAHVPEAFRRLRERDRQRAVEAMLARLPDAMREVVVLRFYEDLDLAEIAEATGLPVGTVKSRLFYAIRRVREMAAEEGLHEAL